MTERTRRPQSGDPDPGSLTEQPRFTGATQDRTHGRRRVGQALCGVDRNLGVHEDTLGSLEGRQELELPGAGTGLERHAPQR